MDHKRGVKEPPKPPHVADGAPLAPKLLQAVHLCPVRDPAVFGGWGAALLDRSADHMDLFVFLVLITVGSFGIDEVHIQAFQNLVLATSVIRSQKGLFCWFCHDAIKQASMK